MLCGRDRRLHACRQVRVLTPGVQDHFHNVKPFTNELVNSLKFAFTNANEIRQSWTFHPDVSNAPKVRLRIGHVVAMCLIFNYTFKRRAGLTSL